jgi:hypothetical protein
MEGTHALLFNGIPVAKDYVVDVTLNFIDRRYTKECDAIMEVAKTFGGVRKVTGRVIALEARVAGDCAVDGLTLDCSTQYHSCIIPMREQFIKEVNNANSN